MFDHSQNFDDLKHSLCFLCLLVTINTRTQLTTTLIIRQRSTSTLLFRNSMSYSRERTSKFQLTISPCTSAQTSLRQFTLHLSSSLRAFTPLLRAGSATWWTWRFLFSPRTIFVSHEEVSHQVRKWIRFFSKIKPHMSESNGLLACRRAKFY